MTHDIQSPILYDTICMPWYILHTGVGSKLNIEKKVILKILEILILIRGGGGGWGYNNADFT